MKLGFRNVYYSDPQNWLSAHSIILIIFFHVSNSLYVIQIMLDQNEWFLIDKLVHEQIFTLLSSFHMSWIVILCVHVRCQSCLKVIMHVQINHNYRYVSKAQFKNFMSIAHRGQHCNYIFSKSSNKIIWCFFVAYRFVCCFNFDNEWDDFEN